MHNKHAEFDKNRTPHVMRARFCDKFNSQINPKVTVETTVTNKMYKVVPANPANVNPTYPYEGPSKPGGCFLDVAITLSCSRQQNISLRHKNNNYNRNKHNILFFWGGLLFFSPNLLTPRPQLVARSGIACGGSAARHTKRDNAQTCRTTRT
jgi:hypothetical protein